MTNSSIFRDAVLSAWHPSNLGIANREIWDDIDFDEMLARSTHLQMVSDNMQAASGGIDVVRGAYHRALGRNPDDGPLGQVWRGISHSRIGSDMSQVQLLATTLELANKAIETIRGVRNDPDVNNLRREMEQNEDQLNDASSDDPGLEEAERDDETSERTEQDSEGNGDATSFDDGQTSSDFEEADDDASTDDEAEALMMAAVMTEQADESQEADESMSIAWGKMASLLDLGTPGGMLEDMPGIWDERCIKLLADAIGWADKYNRGLPRPQKSDTGPVADYEMGYFEENTVPDEMLQLANGDLYTTLKAVEGHLTNTVHETEKDAGLGPMIILSDHSYSMFTSSVSTPHGRFNIKQVARSMELALALSCLQQGRDVACVDWSTWAEEIFIYGRDDRRLKDHLARYGAGGTYLIKPLGDVMAEMEKMGWEGRADILVITDGEFLGDYSDYSVNSYVEAFNEVMDKYRKQGTRVWIVTVGLSSRGRDLIERISDGFIQSDQLEIDSNIGELIRQMVEKRSNAREI